MNKIGNFAYDRERMDKYIKLKLLFKMCILIAALLTMSCDRTRQKETVMDKNISIRVLIVDGFNNHDWKQTTKGILQILDQPDLRLSVEVSTTPSLPDSPEWDTWKLTADKQLRYIPKSS